MSRDSTCRLSAPATRLWTEDGEKRQDPPAGPCASNDCPSSLIYGKVKPDQEAMNLSLLSLDRVTSKTCEHAFPPLNHRIHLSPSCTCVN